MPIQPFYEYCKSKQLLKDDQIAYIAMLEKHKKNTSLISFLGDIFYVYANEYEFENSSTIKLSISHLHRAIDICYRVIEIQNHSLQPSNIATNQEDYTIINFLLYLSQKNIHICPFIIQYCKDLLTDLQSLQPFFTISPPSEDTRAPFEDSDDIFRLFGARPDRIIIASNSIFQSRLAYYMDSIKRRALLLDTNTLVNKDDTTLMWVRDPLITTQRGLAVSVLYNNNYTFNKYPNIYTRCITQDHIYYKYQHFLKPDSDEHVMSTSVKCLTASEQKAFENYHIQYHLEHNFKIAGGNVIKAYNKAGELIYIVGLAAVFSLMDIKYRYDDHPQITQQCLTEKQKMRVQNNPDELKSYLEFKTIKRLIRNFLIGDPEDTAKRVIFVDHASYHIDLDALYVAPGLILVNSYSLFLDALPAINDQHFLWSESKNVLLNKSNYVWYFSQMKLRYEKQLNRFAEQLKKRGFDVYRTAGSSLYTDERNPLSFSPVYRSESMQNFHREVAFCYVNGIVCQLSENHLDILIPASPIGSSRNTLREFFLLNFINLITRIVASRRENMRIICIDVSKTKNLCPNDRGGVVTRPEEFMLLSQGGLRCSVNKIPQAFIEDSETAAPSSEIQATSAPVDVQ